jgi:hypothetical protein
MKSLEQRQVAGIKMVVLLYASMAAVIVPLVLFHFVTPRYDFEPWGDHPEFINRYIESGRPVVLVIHGNCSHCEKTKVDMIDLQSQLQGVSVYLGTQTQSIMSQNTSPLIFFAYVNVSDNATSDVIAQQYDVQQTPTIIVIRGDGAVATFVPKDEIDINAIRSAIADAEKWYESHSTPTPIK